MYVYTSQVQWQLYVSAEITSEEFAGLPKKKCVCGRMLLEIEIISLYAVIQLFRTGDELCFLWGNNSIFKYHLHEFQAS